MMWNHSGHLEAFFGVPCAGGILHTLNLRLHPHEIAAIVNHAGDRFLLIDDVLLPTLEKFRANVSFERVIVVPYCGSGVPEGFQNYEDLLASATDDFQYPAIDENDGAAMCYTSGTTGTSKGVLYSHRALVLHTLRSWGSIRLRSATTTRFCRWRPCFMRMRGACPILARWPEHD